MAPGRVAIVTGANKGIGLAIVRHLALQYPSSNLKDGPLLIYLTARDRQRGEAALKSLESDAQLTSAKALYTHGGLTQVQYHPLDIAQTKSIQELRAHLEKTHPDGIDVLVNNAGIALDGFDAELAKKTLEVNYYGTLEACQDLLPLVRGRGRVVNLSSMAGSLGKYSPKVQEAFRSAKAVPEVTKLVEQFKTAMRENRVEQEGFTKAAYAFSKASITAMTRALAHDEQVRAEKAGKVAEARLINCCCPGYVNTDMTKGNGALTVDRGAQTPVLLALGDLGNQSGLYWKNEKPQEW